LVMEGRSSVYYVYLLLYLCTFPYFRASLQVNIDAERLSVVVVGSER
jgi:hypothetical protein